MRRLSFVLLVLGLFAGCKTSGTAPPTGDDDDAVSSPTGTPVASPTSTPPAAGGYPTGLEYPVLPDPPLSGTAPPPPSGVRTFYQTNGGWDPRFAVPADMVVVSAHGADAGYVSSTLGSWAGHGFPTGRMFQANADGGVLYTGGDPSHPEIERNKSGQALGVDDRPYITPSDGWRTFLEGQADIGIAGGAGTVLVEEALLHQTGGYDARFKTAWQAHYGSAWADPTASPATAGRRTSSARS